MPEQFQLLRDTALSQRPRSPHILDVPPRSNDTYESPVEDTAGRRAGRKRERLEFARAHLRIHRESFRANLSANLEDSAQVSDRN